MISLAGLALPELSAYDPPVEGEGSLDPMGLAAISDRLADRLVPGVRARMQRVRFVTAMAVGAMACETLADELSADGISTPAICFEWLVIEGLVRRLSPQEIPPGVPGSQKARVVVNRKQRLSAATYLKGPSVFGFNGVYKPFAVDAHVVSSDLEPGPRCAELTRRWEAEQGFAGFTDAVPGTDGGRLRAQLRDQVRDALRAGRCTTNPSSWLFGQLAASLHPDQAGPGERRLLRSLITGGEHETRAELAAHLAGIEGELSEAELLAAVRPSCSPALGSIVDAVVAYERFAALVDVAFRTLCAVSHSMGAQPLTPAFGRAARDDRALRPGATGPLPPGGRADGRHRRRGQSRGTARRVRHPAVGEPSWWNCCSSTTSGSRPASHRRASGRGSSRSATGGWSAVPYGTAEQPQLGARFVHPVRVAALRRFLEDTAT